jgi:ferredoxin
MIVAKRKPFDEIKEMIQPYKKVLNVGCGTCVAVCLVGGEKEVAVLSAEIEMARKLDDNPIQIDGYTVERQCDREYLAELDEKVDAYDALISMACGVGVQFLAVNQAAGWYEERCRSCSSCVLGWTGGICPVTMCAKGLYNGPCGGTNKGSCEINKEQPCAWYMIYERLSKQGRLENIMRVHPVNDWRDQVPRTLIQPGYKKPEN